MIFSSNLSTLNFGLMMSGRARWQEAEATRKDFNVVLSVRTRNSLPQSSSRSFRTQSTLSCSEGINVLIPNNFFEYINHIGCAVNLSGLIPRGQNSSQGQTDGILYSRESHAFRITKIRKSLI